MKEITITEKWQDGKETQKKIRRLSRWIKVRTAIDITPRSTLWDYVTDENGLRPYDDSFNAENGTYCDYFVFRGIKYALDRFYRLGCMWLPYSYSWQEKDGLHYISGCDMYGNLYHSYLIEMDKCGEYVRVYEEV